MLNGPRLNKRAAMHWAWPAYVKQPITAYNKRQTRPVGSRHYALHSPASRSTSLPAASGHHSSLAVLTCRLRTAIASQLSGHHRHTAVPTQQGRRARYTLPLSTSSSNLSTSRSQWGRRARYTRRSNLAAFHFQRQHHGKLAAATSPLSDSLRKESTIHTPQQPFHFSTHWGRRARYKRRSNLAASHNSSKQVAN